MSFIRKEINFLSIAIQLYGCLVVWMEFPTNSYRQLEPYYAVIVTNSVTKENHEKLGLIDAMSCPKHDKNNKRKENFL